MARKTRVPFRVRPMLATLVAHPFHRPGWVYEEKYDGYRLLAYKEGKRITLLSRTGHDRTQAFAGIAEAAATLKAQTLLLDGEAVAFDRSRVSRFQLLQQGKTPVDFATFDCLYLNGRDLRQAPLAKRRAELERVIGRTGRIFPARRLGTRGLAAYRAAKRKGFEGIIAKDDSSAYEQRRSVKWLKVKVHQEEELVIGGYTRPSGSRSYFGALVLGAYSHDDLHYVGKVGTGFSQEQLASLWGRFQPLVIAKAAFVDPPRERGVTWLKPHLVAQVAFSEWTEDRRLRVPRFLGLRDDKEPKDCRLPEGLGAAKK